MATKNTVKINRSAISGRFVKPSTVQRHPDKTVTETRPKPSKKK